jgi:hypothetical protein
MFAALHNPSLAPRLLEGLLPYQRSAPQHLLSQACYPFHPNPFSLTFLPFLLPSFLSVFLRPQTPLALTSLVLLALKEAVSLGSRALHQ